MLDRGCSGGGDVNWMKYSGGARDETHVLRSATLRRCTRSIGCSDWPAAASRSAVGLSGRSNAVKHERPAFIFIKRCLSATYSATGTLPPARTLSTTARPRADRQWTWYGRTVEAGAWRRLRAPRNGIRVYTLYCRHGYEVTTKELM